MILCAVPRLPGPVVRPTSAAELHQADEEAVLEAKREDPEVADLRLRPAECAGQCPRGLEDRHR